MSTPNGKAPHPNQNEHHKAFPASFYTKGKLREFRERPCNRVWMDVNEHKHLHAVALETGIFPPVPSPKQVKRYLAQCRRAGCTMDECKLKRGVSARDIRSKDRTGKRAAG